MASRPDAERPNIVLITCHDLGRHLACYGVPTVHTGALDALAADGVRFTNAFCPSPGCSPSRAALATGRYPHSNGVMGLSHAQYRWDLGPGERHIANRMGDAGYYPVLFGLQHVTPRPENMGFRRMFPRHDGAAVASNLRRFLANDRPRQPLYIEINYMEPHRPFGAGGVQPDDSLGVTVPPWLEDTEAARAEFAAIQGSIRRADESVGMALAALADADLLGETLLIFTTDHGIAFPRAKGTLYDPGIETALIVRWPAGIRIGGRTEDALISNVDILPTLLEAVGAPIPDNVQGRSFLPLLAGGPYTRRDAVYAEKTFHDTYNPLRSIRTERHKLIARLEVAHAVEVPGDAMTGGTFATMIPDTLRPAGRHIELYDLKADPLERQDLAGRPEHAQVERDLKRRLLAWMEETDDPLLRGPVASPFYHDTIRALREA